MSNSRRITVRERNAIRALGKQEKFTRSKGYFDVASMLSDIAKDLLTHGWYYVQPLKGARQDYS